MAYNFWTSAEFWALSIEITWICVGSGSRSTKITWIQILDLLFKVWIHQTAKNISNAEFNIKILIKFNEISTLNQIIYQWKWEQLERFLRKQKQNTGSMGYQWKELKILNNSHFEVLKSIHWFKSWKPLKLIWFCPKMSVTIYLAKNYPF